METFSLGMLGAAFVFGLRHGADLDHLAAITDIAGTQSDRRRALWLCSLYAAGHAAVVFFLGIIAIYFGEFVPSSLDRVMGRITGFTLVVLGLSLLLSLWREGRAFRFRSRWTMALGLVTWIKTRWQLRRGGLQVVEVEHDHPHDHTAPGHTHAHAAERSDAASSQRVTTLTAHSHRHTHRALAPANGVYGGRGAFTIGLIHGVGAETPTQVLLLLAAAGVGGRAVGILLLATFICGLVLTNTAIAAASSYGFLRASQTRLPVLAIMGAITATFSVALGLALLLN